MRDLAGAFRNAAIGTALVGTDHRILAVNRSLCEFLGRTEAEMLAHSVHGIVHPGDEQADRKQLAQLLTGETDSSQREMRYLHKLGHVLWGDLTCTLVRDQDRLPLFFIAQVHDITERKQAEQAMRKSEVRFRSLMNLSSDRYWEQDDQFRFVRFLSHENTSVWSIDGDKLLGRCRWDAHAAFPLRGTWADHRAVLETQQPFRGFEYVDLEDTAAPRYRSISGDPMFDASGQFTGYCGTASDITQSKLGEMRQREAQAMLALAAQVGRLGAWAFDVGASTLTWSEEVCAIHEVKPGLRPTLQEAAAFITPEHLEKIRSTFRSCVKSGSPFDVEAEIVTGKGRRVWVRLLGEAEWDAQCNVRRVHGALQDISQSKLVEREVLRLNVELEHRVCQRTAQLEAANRELEAFSYSVAHDLRAPLTAIDKFSEALDDKVGNTLDDRSRHFLARIRAGAKKMGDLTDGLLSLASLSRTELRMEPVDLAVMARAALASCRERFPGRSVDVTVAAALPAHGDPRLMAQVIDNLVCNAWKFTSHRSQAVIDVGCALDAAGEKVYRVRDNGAGFDMAHAAKMFQAFERLHPDTEFEGTGIGLAIVHRIITRHGGRIWAEGAVDEGASFHFTLGAHRG